MCTLVFSCIVDDKSLGSCNILIIYLEGCLVIQSAPKWMYWRDCLFCDLAIWWKVWEVVRTTWKQLKLWIRTKNGRGKKQKGQRKNEKEKEKKKGERDRGSTLTKVECHCFGTGSRKGTLFHFQNAFEEIKKRRYLVGGTKSMSLHLWQCGVSNQLILVLSGWLQRSVFFRWLLWCLFSWGCIFDFLWGL